MLDRACGRLWLDGPALPRRPDFVSNGVHYVGFVLPTPSRSDIPSSIVSVGTRIGLSHLPANRRFLRLFGKFVHTWVRKHLRPLEDGPEFSFEGWLKETRYPEWRKEQLRTVREAYLGQGFDKKATANKAFTKAEFYVKPTMAIRPRQILAREDIAKMLLGPIVQAMTKAVMRLPWFVKVVPVCDRPMYINQWVHGTQYLEVDYTAWESNFSRDLFSVCEFQLYDWLTTMLPEHQWFMRYCFNVLGGRNRIYSKHWMAQVDACRMTGEMTTSLGNGFTNLMLVLFLFQMKGAQNVTGVVEGDDGLFGFTGPSLTVEDFAVLGVRAKVAVKQDLASCTFCSTAFNVPDNVNIVDPLKALLRCGWVHTKYLWSSNQTMVALVRARGMSLAYSNPGCPIVQELGWALIRMSEGVSYYKVLKVINKMADQYEQARFKQALNAELRRREPTTLSRLMCEEVFGVPVETQIKMERYLATLSTLGPIQHSSVDDYMEKGWQECWQFGVVLSKHPYCNPPVNYVVDREMFEVLARVVHETNG